MAKLFDHFTAKFKENLPKTKSMEEAFERTNEEIGFEAYSSFHSYNTVRKRNKKGQPITD